MKKYTLYYEDVNQTKKNVITKNHLNDISHASSLDDIDLEQMLVHLRHAYLEAAKDLCKEDRVERDLEIGEMACDNVLNIQNILDSIGF